MIFRGDVGSLNNNVPLAYNENFKQDIHIYNEWESGWEAMTQRPFPEACAILFVNTRITSIPFVLAVFATFFILQFILKHIEKFKYLSSMISENGGSEEEVTSSESWMHGKGTKLYLSWHLIFLQGYLVLS